MKSIKMLAVWTAIASFFGLSGNIETTDLTEEMVGQVNDQLADLTAKNADLNLKIEASAKKFETLSASHDALQGVHAETLRQFDVLKAEDAARETQVTKRADKSAETIASDNYLHNQIADQNI